MLLAEGPEGWEGSHQVETKHLQNLSWKCAMWFPKCGDLHRHISGETHLPCWNGSSLKAKLSLSPASQCSRGWGDMGVWALFCCSNPSSHHVFYMLHWNRTAGKAPCSLDSGVKSLLLITVSKWNHVGWKSPGLGSQEATALSARGVM